MTLAGRPHLFSSDPPITQADARHLPLADNVAAATVTSPPSPIGIAWLTGLFDGEGTVVWRGRAGVELAIKMTDRDLIERVHEVTACGYTYGPFWNRGPGIGKPMWAWSCGRSEDVQRLLEFMQPLLGQRRKERALAALERLSANPGRHDAQCGSSGGYHRHLRRREPVCADCRAWNATEARRRRRFVVRRPSAGQLTLSTDPGDLVVDPCAGSGTTGRAALALGREAALFDLIGGS